MGTMTTIRLDKNFDINIHGGEQLSYVDMTKKEKCTTISCFSKKKNRSCGGRISRTGFIAVPGYLLILLSDLKISFSFCPLSGR